MYCVIADKTYNDGSSINPSFPFKDNKLENLI